MSHASILTMVFIFNERRVMRTCLLSISLLFILSTFISAGAKEYSLGTQEECTRTEARVLESPVPEIPSEYKDEAFKSSVVARFNIAADSKTTVKLLNTSGNEEIDKLVLNTLKKWKFQAATVDDVPVESNRKLRIELEVE